MIIFFSIFLGLLLNDTSDYDKFKLGPFAFFIIALRESISDYDTDNLTKSDYHVLIWIVWFVIMIIGNFISTNFNIAIINQTFE